jgi:hypothetical protein
MPDALDVVLLAALRRSRLVSGKDHWRLSFSNANVTNIVTKIKMSALKQRQPPGGGAGASVLQAAKNTGAWEAYRLSRRGEGAGVKTA